MVIIMKQRATVKDKTARQTLRARLRHAFCVATGSRCRLESDGAKSLVVQGCCGIEVYRRDCIVLLVRDPDFSRLCIGGADLFCHSYHEQGVRITGQLRQILYCGADDPTILTTDSEQ